MFSAIFHSLLQNSYVGLVAAVIRAYRLSALKRYAPATISASPAIVRMNKKGRFWDTASLTLLQRNLKYLWEETVEPNSENKRVK
jgi:hypothetical protein